MALLSKIFSYKQRQAGQRTAECDHYELWMVCCLQTRILSIPIIPFASTYLYIHCTISRPHWQMFGLFETILVRLCQTLTAHAF